MMRLPKGSRSVLLVACFLCIYNYPTTEGASSSTEIKAFVSAPWILDRTCRPMTNERRLFALRPLQMARESVSKQSPSSSGMEIAVSKAPSKGRSTKAKKVAAVKSRPIVEDDIYEVPEQRSIVKRDVMEQVLMTGSVTEVPAKEDLECLSVLTLKEICADLGLVQRGRKSELIDRIDAARSGGTEKQQRKRQKAQLRDMLEAQLRTEWNDRT